MVQKNSKCFKILLNCLNEYELFKIAWIYSKSSIFFYCVKINYENCSKYFKMFQFKPKWFMCDQNVSNLIIMIQIWSKWFKFNQNSSGIINMVQNASKWLKLFRMVHNGMDLFKIIYFALLGQNGSSEY